MKKQHTNVIRRTIAVGLAALMFFVPLSTGMGKGMGAKADDPSGTSGVTATYNNTNTPNEISTELTDETISGKQYEVLESTGTPSDAPKYSLHVLDDSVKIDASVHTTMITREGDEAIYTFSTTLKGGGPNGETNFDVDVDVTVTCTVKYDSTETFCLSGDDVTNSYMSEKPAGAVDTFTLDGTKDWYVFARPLTSSASIEFKQIENVVINGNGSVGWNDPNYSEYYSDEVERIFEDQKETAAAFVNNSNRTAYSLQFIYTRVVDTLESGKIVQTWNYTPSTPFNDTTKDIYGSASMKPTVDYGSTATNGDYYIGTFKHVVKKSGAVATPLTEAELAAIDSTSWSTDTLDTGNETGYFYDYVAYFVDDSYVKCLQTSNSVYIDADAPVVNSFRLFKATKDEAGNITEWRQMNVEDGYVLNLGEGSDLQNDAYCYVVQAQDSGSGVASVTGHIVNNNNDPKFFEKNDETIVFYDLQGTAINGSDLYCYRIKYKDLPDDAVLQMNVNAEDKVGNKLAEDIAISPTVKKFKSELAVSVALSVDGQPIATLPERSQKPVKLTIEATSGSPIAYIDLYNNGESLGRITRADVEDATHFVDRTSTVGGATMHTVTWEGYTLPATSINAKYTDLRLEVKDDYVYTGEWGPYWKELFEKLHIINKPLDDGSLIYDITVPVISYSDEYDGIKWYQDYKVSGNIVSGIQDVEDDFEYAEYYMSENGSVDEINDQPTALAQDEGAQKPTCSFEFDVAPSENLIGTQIVFAAKDKSGNLLQDDNRTMVIHVDGENPVINKDEIYVVKKGTDEGKKVSADSNLEGGNFINGNPVLKASVRDNLTIGHVDYTVKFPDGSEKLYTDAEVYGLDAPGVDCPLAFEIPNPSGTGEAIDGSYEVTIQAYDKSGRESEKQSVRFILDNTKPILSSWISVGTKGGKSPREDGTDWYYKSEQVWVSFKIDDDNIDTSKLVVKDNDSEVSVLWTGGNGFLCVTGNGSHTVTFEGTDAVGNPGATQTVSFIIDTVEPAVSVQINGQSYSASRGRINSTQDVYVSFNTSDANPDYNDYYCRIVRQLPGQTDSVREYMSTSMTDYSFSEDGDYTVTFYATDRAGNSSSVYSAMFRVDKNAPQLQIVGANGSATSDTAVTLVVNETMWQDATAEATIYRRAGDGKEELVYKTIQLRLTSAETRISELLRETGTYRIELSAKDAIGHSTSTSHTFTLDKNAPIVSQTGVSNYDKTDQPVTFYTEIHDDFYATKTVSVSGTRTDQSGKVTVLEFPNVKQNANPTIIESVFEEDGIYEVSVYVRDAAGNEKSSVLHFVIDKEAPVIGSLEDYEDKMFREFSWDLELDELVSDLTVCDVHMYLNGREYDGESAIEDGVYTLLITAEDELGHKSEKSATFTLDTKPPVFIVTGVEDGEIKQETYSIDVSLQLDEDMLKVVMLNGVPATIRENNTAHIDVTQEGDYSLTMAASDKAGNESMQVISFTYGVERQKRNWLVVILASGGGVLALGGGIFFAAKRRRKY